MDLENLTSKVRDLTAEVVGFISTESLRFDSSKIELKGKSDLVSYVDRESEKKLVKGLSKLLPSAVFLTEEKTVQQGDGEYQWIIDPLDGTTNFVHGIPAYAISIALSRNNEMILGVVHEVTRKECFWAWKGGGAFLNEVRIHVSSISSMDESLFATGFPIQEFAKKESYMKIISQLIVDTHGLRRIGSAALDLAYVACGRTEGFFECNLNAWDVAAGTLIVQEAGGVVSDFSGGRNFLFGKEIVAGGTVHPDLVGVIQKYWF
ncbi:MAG: inositol monophosphatase [Cytophagales bacterium]|nr:inositol monophosphatase [Cytophagales bacterium]